MNYRKVLIAVDDSPAAEKVAENGFQLGKQLNAEIALVSVVDTSLLITEGNVTPKEMADMIKKDLKKNQQILIDKVFKSHKLWTFTEEGKPHEVILKTAEEWDAGIIVLGTQGRTGLAHVLMGSVAEKVIRHSDKPVLVIPAKS